MRCLVCAPPCMCTVLSMHRLVCGLRLPSLDAGDTPARPLNKKTPTVATNRLLCAVPCVRTALYVHRLVYAPRYMWTTAPFARCGQHPRTPPQQQDSCGGHRRPFVCTALCVHRLVCEPPCVCTALYVDYVSLRSMRGTLPHPPSITRLVRWPHTAFCVHRLVCAKRCMCTALCMHHLVCGLRLASLHAGDTPTHPLNNNCIFTTDASLHAGDTPTHPLNNKTPAVATNRLLCAAPCVCTTLYVHRLFYAP